MTTFPSVHIEGGLIPADVIVQLSNEDITRQQPANFNLDGNAQLSDQIVVIHAELDAYYARPYGLTTNEPRYILDPENVYGPDFSGETFRVLKEKEIKKYGEYRTRRLVLEAWERLGFGRRYGVGERR